MHEETFEKAYPLALRSAQVRSAAAVASGGIQPADREHLEQEALTRVWLALSQYDPTRAGLRTFIEVVVSRQFTSMLRARRRRPQIESLDAQHVAVQGRFSEVDIRTDVIRVFDRVSQFDRAVGFSLTEYSAVETSRRLRVSRASVYRAIERLRVAFTTAGYAGRKRRPSGVCPTNCHARPEASLLGARA
jgi:DNA-directed RNA polymerase specialized sigma24 family protein